MRKILAVLLALLPTWGFADVVRVPSVGGGGAATSVTSGTTTVTGATSCLMRADASSVLQCTAYLTADGTLLSIGGAATAANAISFQETAGCITFEGATSNAFQGRLCQTDPTADQTYNLPSITAGAQTFAMRDVDNGFSASQTWALSTGPAFINVITVGGIQGRTTLTPDGWFLFAGSLANSVHVAETADATFDFNNGPCGTSACTDPTLIGHSHNQSTTEYWSLSHDGSNANLNVGTGVLRQPQLALTAATMTAENTAGFRTTTSSYTWTNAQVVALGAATTGNITAVTLPAKTVVENAYVVITGQGAGTTTLTVSCGRTGAGYIDYIVASDAKAAASTVYGDASGERGTNLTGYDLPSYTATTDVVCQFISTVQNLDQTTGSTGRLILKTSLVP